MWTLPPAETACSVPLPLLACAWGLPLTASNSGLCGVRAQVDPFPRRRARARPRKDLEDVSEWALGYQLRSSYSGSKDTSALESHRRTELEPKAALWPMGAGRGRTT